jgi:hypothetical protein
MAANQKRYLWQSRIDSVEVSMQKLKNLGMLERQLESSLESQPEKRDEFWNTAYINKK